MVEKGQKYRHFKGHIMEVLYIGKHSETLEDMVIYKHVEDDNIWVRPLEMFLSKDDISSRSDNITGQKYRFELIKEEEK